MRRFLLGHAGDADWPTLCQRCLEQIGEVPVAFTLGFVYGTSALAPYLGPVLRRLREATGVAHWSGCVGVGVAATGREYYDGPALVVLLGDIPPEDFRIIPALGEDCAALSATHGRWLHSHRHHLGVVHADPRHPGIAVMLSRLAAIVPGACLIGGLISSAGEAHLQVADGPLEGGLSGVVFSPRVQATTGLSQGCVPVGPRHRVTDCEIDLVHTLDGRPALDVLFEDSGEILARDPRRLAGYIFAALPVPGGAGDGYLVRGLLSLDLGERSIRVGEHMRPGQVLQFCRRDGNAAREDLVRMLRALRRRLPGPARGGLYYSCLGRGRHLFGGDSAELRLIREHLGEVPLAGFFAGGEIHDNRLHAYTGVLTLFS